MKKTILMFVVVCATAGMMLSCGDGGAAEKAAAEKEAARQDSLRAVIEKSESDLVAKEAELQRAYDELQALHEQSKAK